MFHMKVADWNGTCILWPFHFFVFVTLFKVKRSDVINTYA
jgi:hypothetical protein